MDAHTDALPTDATHMFPVGAEVSDTDLKGEHRALVVDLQIAGTNLIHLSGKLAAASIIPEPEQFERAWVETIALQIRSLETRLALFLKSRPDLVPATGEDA